MLLHQRDIFMIDLLHRQDDLCTRQPVRIILFCTHDGDADVNDDEDQPGHLIEGRTLVEPPFSCPREWRPLLQ